MASHQNCPLHKFEPGSPYCADPNCLFCKALREALERLQDRKEKPQANEHAA
jgi:hypothetical protein